ncbi:unnamed protein product, partial [Urochloa humidicola]
ISRARPSARRRSRSNSSPPSAAPRCASTSTPRIDRTFFAIVRPTAAGSSGLSTAGGGPSTSSIRVIRNDPSAATASPNSSTVGAYTGTLKLRHDQLVQRAACADLTDEVVPGALEEVAEKKAQDALVGGGRGGRPAEEDEEHGAAALHLRGAAAQEARQVVLELPLVRRARRLRRAVHEHFSPVVRRGPHVNCLCRPERASAERRWR